MLRLSEVRRTGNVTIVAAVLRSARLWLMSEATEHSTLSVVGR